jgi:hypothetical protein
MTKIDQIKHAISEANFFRSKLTPEALAVPGMTSLKIRHLMNNLGAIGTRFAEIGTHKGGTFCSTIFQNENLINAFAVDNFSEFTEDGNPMQELLSNVAKCKCDATQFSLLIKDCWDINPHPQGVDLFLYDGNHSAEAQERAMTHFIPWMADEFIFCIDDFSAWPWVKPATEAGIALAELRHKIGKEGYRVLFQQELWDGNEGNNMGWHNGYVVYLFSRV